MKKYILVILIGLLFIGAGILAPNIRKDVAGFYFTFNGDTVATIDSSGMITSDSISITYTPTIYTYGGDTSNYPTPNKSGDIFVDSTNDKVYISIDTLRGTWVILN